MIELILSDGLTLQKTTSKGKALGSLSVVYLTVAYQYVEKILIAQHSYSTVAHIHVYNIYHGNVLVITIVHYVCSIVWLVGCVVLSLVFVFVCSILFYLIFEKN